MCSKMTIITKPKRSKAQIKQLSLLKAMRRYKALGFAYKMAPIVNPMITEGLSQRAIAVLLTAKGIVTASEWVSNKSIKEGACKNIWSQTQVARLLNDMEQVKNKMKWYYVKAHQYNSSLFSGGKDPLANRYTGKFYKLVKHQRKTPIDYYRDKMNDFRFQQMSNSGYCDFMVRSEIAEEYTRFTKRKSYHKAKKQAILKPLKITPL